jgi:DNA (cytosine-5)-methyltransferase 1
MGVPHKRERVFFICQRKDLNLPKLKVDFNENLILYKILEDKNTIRKKATGEILKYLEKTLEGKSLAYNHPKGNFFTSIRLDFNDCCNTIASNSGSNLFHPIKNEYLTNIELQKIGTYPLDFNFQNVEPQYLIGMSVPPVMTAQIANQIYIQWLSKL